MKWLKNKVRNWLTSDDEIKPSVLISGSTVDPVDNDTGIHFTVFNVIGGRLVRVRQYDSVKDRSFFRAYIIVDSADFDQELSRIIAMESIRL